MRGHERKHRTHNNQQKTCENWKTAKKRIEKFFQTGEKKKLNYKRD
jgi:hypothetical protein